jgi:hypothetical protein
MRHVAALAGIVVVLAVPATASAGKIKLQGNVAGTPSSNVQLTVRKDEGDLEKITKLKFQRVPLNCSDGTSGAISGQTVRSFEVRGKDFTRRTRIAGPGISKGFFRVSGKFRRGGRVAKGFVRFAITSTTGAGCGTGNVRWKATK